MFTKRIKDLVAVSLFTIFLIATFPLTAQATETYEYDDLNRLKKVMYDVYYDAKGKVVEYTYDDAGNRSLKVPQVFSVAVHDTASPSSAYPLVVYYGARSLCDGGESPCSYSWAIPTVGTAIGPTDAGGNVLYNTDSLHVQYSGAGTYSEEVTVESVNRASASSTGILFDQVFSVTKSITGTAVDNITNPPPSSTATFNLDDTVAGKLTITQGTIDPNVESVAVYWGDRTRDVYPVYPDSAGVVLDNMIHPYPFSGNRNIRITVFDTAGARTSYSYTATIP